MTTKPLKLLLVAGARPNFVKIAPLISAMQRQNQSADPKRRLDFRLIHTGQHYDARMSQVFFDEMGIPAPDFNLEVGSGSHAVQTAKIMMAFEPVCVDVQPDWLVVVGDVNSTMACTVVASKLGGGPGGNPSPSAIAPANAGAFFWRKVGDSNVERRPGRPRAIPGNLTCRGIPARLGWKGATERCRSGRTGSIANRKYW